MCEGMCVCGCVCEREMECERERECVCERERECVCVRERRRSVVDVIKLFLEEMSIISHFKCNK